MPIPRINKGDPITAAWLGMHTDAINGLGGLGSDGAPGAGRRVGTARRREYLGAIVARTVPAGDPPYLFHLIEYEALVPEISPTPLAVTFDKRTVAVAAALLGPGADPAMLFFPAPIVGTAEQITAPWRGYCRVTVLHSVGDPDGPPLWWASVPGEAPAYGCEAAE